MKSLSIIISFSLLVLTAANSLANKDTSLQQQNIHKWQDGDVVRPLTAPSKNALSISRGNTDGDSTSRLIRFNPSDFVDNGSSLTRIVYSNDTISYICGGIRHIYLQKGDTLSYLGHDSRQTRLRLDLPVRVALHPLTPCVALTDTATATVEHSQRKLLRHAKVRTLSNVTGDWTATDGENSYNNLLRLDWTMELRYDTLFNATFDTTLNLLEEGIVRTESRWDYTRAAKMIFLK